MQLAVGTVGRAHGLRGEVAVDVRTDRPAERFAVGGALATDRGPLVVVGARRQGVHWYLTFEGVADRTAAEGLRGTELRVELEEPGRAGRGGRVVPARARGPACRA